MFGAILGGLSVFSSLLGSKSQSDSLDAQAQQYELSAIEAEETGKSQASAIRSQADSIIGSTISAAAGSGVQVGTGSVLDVIEDTAFNIELDALTVESDAKREADALRQGAASSKAAKPSGVSTLLGAFGSGATGYATGLSLNS